MKGNSSKLEGLTKNPKALLLNSAVVTPAATANFLRKTSESLT